MQWFESGPGPEFRLQAISSDWQSFPKNTVMTANRSASVYLSNNIRIGNDRAIPEVVKRPVVDRNQHMLSAQKCDDRHFRLESEPNSFVYLVRRFRA
jgi:hypothetical protein